MTTKDSNRTRSLVWEDVAPAEARFRRERQGLPAAGRTLPGMPLEMEDPDGEATRRGGFGSSRERLGGPDRGSPKRPWWRPSSSLGRTALTLGAVIVLGSVAASAYLLKNYLGRDSRFRIHGADNIEVTGLTEVSRAEMLPVFGEDIGRNIFFVPLGERRRQLEQIPWVERATVMRLLPDRIRVAVVERQPVAFARQGQQFGLVDANGVLLTMPAALMAEHHYSFPTLTGIVAADPASVRKARMGVYLRLLAELDASGQKLSAQISEIDLTDPEDAQVTMQDDTTLLHFGNERFLERYRRYKDNIAGWRQQYPKLAAVDLRYDRQAVLQMAPGTSVAQTTADEQSAANATADANAHTDQNPAKPVKTAGKPGGKNAAKAKTAPKRTAKAVREKAKIKKRAAETKRAALNVSRQKTVPTARPATAAVAGQ